MVPDDNFKIVWLQGLLTGEAQLWLQDWQQRGEKGEISDSWRDLTWDITERFHHLFEGRRALQKLLQLEYKGDIHMFLTEFNLLN